MTVEQIIRDKIIELESQECSCVSTLPSDEEDAALIECWRCEEIKKLQEHCMCGQCDDCLELLLAHYESEPCSCTYKTIQVEEIIINEQGEEEVVMVDKQVIDVMCERCKAILDIKKQLSDMDILRNAYIDEKDFDKYEVVDGVIHIKTIEEGKVSDIELLKIENVIQEELITTTMLATAEVNEQLSDTDTMTIISLEALAELNEQIILLQEEINKLKGGVTA